MQILQRSRSSTLSVHQIQNAIMDALILASCSDHDISLALPSEQSFFFAHTKDKKKMYTRQKGKRNPDEPFPVVS
eukprot:m.137499 g.137499  ORF g.137499 m.137499 type:complete len:75 (-) comp15895_c2_seq4:1766-1990(-)